jgi:hypothetical protein
VVAIEPKLTIVIVSLDIGAPLAKTVDSCLPILSDQVKLLIKLKERYGINSTNIAQLLGQSPHIKVVRSVDNGIYQGMNQALQRLRTGFVLFLGAGDVVYPDKFGSALDALGRFDAIPVHFFPTIMASWPGTWFPQPEAMSRRMACPHAGSIIRVELLAELGGFDVRYSIAADYELLSRVLIAGIPYRVHQNPPFVGCSGGGISETRFLEAHLEEELARIRVWRGGYHDALNRLKVYLNSIAFKLLERFGGGYNR